MIRADPWYRRESFRKGLQACGYEIRDTAPTADSTGADLLVIWNRYGHYHAIACAHEAKGGRVIVAENGMLGREWLGEYWYSLTNALPGCAGDFDQGGPERWDSFGVGLCEWRKTGRTVILLAQRGIGPPGVAMPGGWDRAMAEKIKAHGYTLRTRAHPGEKRAVPLEQDLADAICTVSWSSGAALKGLALGVPAYHGLKGWVGDLASWRLQDTLSPFQLLAPPLPDRLPMFQRLGWTMWRIREIETGEPFQRLIGLPYLRFGATRAPSACAPL